MNPTDMAELLELLHQERPGLRIEHLGRLRVRVIDGDTQLIYGLNDEEFPKDWARTLNKLLSTPVMV